jgi:hypothetical protein
MARIKTAQSYTEEFLETDRPQPLTAALFETLEKQVLTGKMDFCVDDSIYEEFIDMTEQHVLGSKLNSVKGLDNFAHKDIIIGCTQFIDNIYMQGPVQTLHDDYRYHQRLGKSMQVRADGLISNVALIIAMPFPQTGAPHGSMGTILQQCLKKNISVHIDGAWITCSRNIDFDLDHPAIKSVGISLSKGLGLGWNRIGVRWRKDDHDDSISIMNRFHMCNKTLVKVGRHYLQNIQPDYLWNTYGDRYRKVCRDFGLEETDSIHIAMRDARPVGVSPLLRYL